MPALETDSHGNKGYGIGFDAYFDEVRAQNFVTDTYGYFAGTYTSIDNSGNPTTFGPWNGAVTRDAYGLIATYFQWRYISPTSGLVTTPPAGSLPPDHMDILLKTRVTAGITLINGVSAEAWATDGAPFQETAGPGQTILGFHLVRAATGSNNIVETYLNGTVHMLAQNLVPFSSTAPYAVSGPAEADASAFVAASAGQDSRNREVYITSPIENPNS